MTISIIHPSRSRPAQAKRTADKWIKNTSGDHNIEYILSIDKSDPYIGNYLNSFDSKVFNVVTSDNNCVVQAANEGAKKSSGEILILVSDDFESFPHWDSKIIEATQGLNSYVLKTFDGLQKWIVALPIMDRAYYELMGYFYHPDYKHQFCDTDMTHVADLQGKLIVRNDILFKHNHYTTGANKKDAVNKRADATWEQGKGVYLNRAKSNFGLDGIDIFKASKEAINHINWMKNELRKIG